jgi:poly-beta-1,6-N-acetyl-D-glucosamine synthase
MDGIAVLIPAWNEAALIGRAIASVIAAGIDPAHVYVVDDGSTDDTAAAAGAAQVLTIPNGGKAKALDTGLRYWEMASRYRYVAILDADSQVAPDYFQAIYRAMREGPADCYCGAPQSLPHNWLTAYRALEYAVTLGIYRPAQSALNVITVAPGCASVYRATRLMQLDFNGRTLVEDMDLTLQIHRQAGRIVHVPDAHVWTQDPATPREYLGQVCRWYRGTWQVVRRHRIGRRLSRIDLELSVMLGESLVFSLLFLLLPLWAWLNPTWVAVGLALDQTTLLALTVVTARSQGRWDILCAFPLFTLPRMLNAGAFLWSFVVERRASDDLAWFSVRRYQIKGA